MIWVYERVCKSGITKSRLVRILHGLKIWCDMIQGTTRDAKRMKSSGNELMELGINEDAKYIR